MRNALEIARKSEAIAQKLRGLADELAEFVTEITGAEVAPLAADGKEPLQIILEATAAFYNVSIKDILGDRQTHRVAAPRHVVMWLCRKHAKMGVEDLGRIFQRDHSTVVIAVRKMEERLQQDQSLRHAIQKIESSIGVPLSFTP